MTDAGDDDPLADLVTAAAVPDLAMRDAVAQGLAAEDGWGRLAELAAWWAGVDPTVSDAESSVAAVALAVAEAAPAVADAVPAGAQAADDLADRGIGLAVVRGGDLVGARALTCVYLGSSPVKVLGWPQAQAGRMVPDDADWADQVRLLQERLRARDGLHRSTPPLTLLTAIDAAEQAWLVAFLLRAAARQLPVLLDGEAALAAATLTRWACPGAVLWWQVADRLPAAAAPDLLGELTLAPVLDLGAVRDGVGADLAVAVLQRSRALARDCLGDRHDPASGVER